MGIKKCGLVIRVSDARQALSEKNSIDIQADELRKYIEVKNCNKEGPSYQEVSLYDLTGVSGQDSFNSRRFEELRSDLVLGKVNVVMCTALDRLGRDVMGFVNFFYELRDIEAELVCTRMSLDTSTATGEAMAMILMALAQLELNIKSERNRRGTLERAKAGLWNGGRLVLGYDLNPDPRIAGRLIVNTEEVPIVKMAYKEYLKLGSDNDVSKLLTQHGYNNKKWADRRTGQELGGDPITGAVVKTILTNITYIAKRRYQEFDEVAGKKVWKIGPGQWEPIIGDALFDQVQDLRRQSNKKKRNITGSKKSKNHFNLLPEISYCRHCGNLMKSRSGTSQYKSRVHYSYYCENDDCLYHQDRIGEKPNRNHVNAEEADVAAFGVLQEILESEKYLKAFTDNLNEHILRELPDIRGNLRVQHNSLQQAKREVLELTKALPELPDASDEKGIAREEIQRLTAIITFLTERSTQTEDKIRILSSRKLSVRDVRERLSSITLLAERSPENQRRELVRYIFDKVVMSEEELLFYLRVDSIGYVYDLLTKRGRFEPIENWRLDEDLNLGPSG